ncbi:MAG: tetratricopeptide repeat protein, partial [Nitrospirae bacterium]|nr:tetratricopeptide repeat protein [Nitrospirota bacterium]
MLFETGFFRENNYFFPFLLYLIALYCATLYYIIRTPLIGPDADMWYHLSHGRYIFQNGKLPENSYFSFILPGRGFIDYYWLFQVLLFGTYSLSKFIGILIVRDSLYFATVTAILFFLVRQRKDLRTFSLIFTACFLVLLMRDLYVRPHAISYLFMVVFIYILEYDKKKIPLLPVLAVLWVNFHGIEYPVMLIVIFAYTAEMAVRKVNKRAKTTAGELFYFSMLAVTLLAPYVTPNGAGLIHVPFVPTRYASMYLDELRHVEPKEVFSFFFSLDDIPYAAVTNVLVVALVVLFITATVRSRLRLSHAIMFAAGVFLLGKCIRFVNEFAILCLPLARAALAGDSSGEVSERPENSGGKPAAGALTIVVSVLLMAIPFLFLKDFFAGTNRFDRSNLTMPHGVAAFLKRVDAGGNVMNYPDKGGYYLWELYPKYSIFMDLEVPFLFTDQDMFTGVNTFYDGAVLEKTIRAHSPEFFTVPVTDKSFGELMKKYPWYVPVFFDDSEVLFANSAKYPSIATKYAIRAIDPFAVTGIKWSELKNSGIPAVTYELERINEVDPNVFISRIIVSMVYNGTGQYEKALYHAQLAIYLAPGKPDGFENKARALIGMKRYFEAIASAKDAIDRSKDDRLKENYRLLSLCYLGMGDYKHAFYALKKDVNYFYHGTSY